MKLFQKMSAALPSATKLVSGLLDESQPPVDEDQGSFGPPGGVLWTTPLDLLLDRPKAAFPTQSAINAPCRNLLWPCLRFPLIVPKL